MTSLSVATASKITSLDLLVVGAAIGPEGPVLAACGLDEEQAAAVQSALVDVGVTGKADEIARVPGQPLGLPPIMVTGLGDVAQTYEMETLRRAAGCALRAAVHAKVAVALPTADVPDAVEAVALGALIGSYRFTELLAADPKRIAITSITVIVDATKGLRAPIARATAIGSAVCLSRRLVDTPPGHQPPAKLAAEAVEAAVGTDIVVEVLDEKALRKQKFGGILAVGKGSANPPRLVRLAYTPARSRAHLALVGKGITFDSGGLSLKPPAGMITMKMDMAGAATVLAAIRAIAQLKIPVTVTAYLAIAENMPSGNAQRPGDVITAYGGKTVEVLNTDAEGRLVMMDALARCGADSPDAIVDVATLTGAQLVALGSRIAGIMGNDDQWRAKVAQAAETAGELAWQMPIPEEMRPSLDSPIADLANMGERNGGMMTAAAFLREFVPAGVPWAHVDIAGPAFNEGAPWAYNGKGATGYGVRMLVALAEQMGH